MNNNNLNKCLVEYLNNKKPFKIDLQNGVILNLEYDASIQAYRGYWPEEDMYVGIWGKKTFVKILSGEINDITIIL